MKNKYFALMSVFILAVSLTACGSNDSGTEEVQLDGTSWVLIAYRKTSPIAGTEPTLNFQDGQASGKASCNSYGGGYTVEGDRIQFDALFMTEMYCMEPEGIMKQENTYLQMLGQAERYEIENGQLILFVPGGDGRAFETLTFEKTN